MYRISKGNMIFVAAAGLLLTTFSAAQAPPSEQTKNMWQHGVEVMRAGKAAEAEADFTKVTEMAPDFAPGWLDLGLAQLKQGKLTLAVDSMQHALKIDPSTHGAHLFLGIAEYQTNHIDSAMSDLQLATREDATNPQAFLWLGIVELNSDHPEKATAPLDRAAELAPEDEGILDYRVQAHMAAARESYARIYQLDAGSWRLHRLNAQIDAQAKQHTQAIDEYQQAIRIEPKQPDLYEGLGWEYRQTGQIDLAVKAFEQELQMTPGNPIAMYNLASARVDSGQTAAAIPLLEQIVKLYGKPTVADYYLGRAYSDIGKNDQAVVELQKAVTVQGETQSRAWFALGQVYKKTGKTSDARAAMEKSQQLHEGALQAHTREAEDWRKLNAAASTTPSQAPASPGSSAATESHP